MRIRTTLLGMALFSVMTMTQARATVLPPGSTVTPDAESNPLNDPTATVLAKKQGSYTTQGGGKSVDLGTYTSWVVREASGKLDFLYQFTANSQSSTSIERLTMYNFTGYTTNVGYVASSGSNCGPGSSNIAPTSASSNTAGSVISFNFSGSNAVEPGQCSDILIIRTNATSYTSGLLSLQDGSTATVACYAPKVVPEPTALALSGVAGVCMLGYARRRRQATV